jgi:hypothetical protein
VGRGWVSGISSAEAFIAIAQSEIYHQIANLLRYAGTAELKLFMTRKIDF